MTVYSDFELAKKEMLSLSIKLKQDIYMTYTKYGNDPTSLEYCLRTKEEMLNIYAFTTCIAIYNVTQGIVDILTMDDLLKYFPNMRNSIPSSHKCGDMPMRGCSSSLDEVVFNNI